eukprot:Skav203057  [mRNA]  locus=scaffold4669:28661:30384:- [translate_table: standard]
MSTELSPVKRRRVDTESTVLFLDLDGVLHSVEADSKDFFAESCVRALRRLVDSFNAQVVLSSTRLSSNLREEAYSQLRDRAVHIIGDTPRGRSRAESRHFGEVEATTSHNITFHVCFLMSVGTCWNLGRFPLSPSFPLASKAEIRAWVEEHRPSEWLALDDLPLELPLEHVVRTDPFTGCSSKSFRVRSFVSK